jgi:hypothetical protein
VPLQHQVGELEQHHRSLNNHYLNKIREMAEIIRRQAEVKDELNKEIHSLALQSQRQHHQVAVLNAKFQQMQQEDRS